MNSNDARQLLRVDKGADSEAVLDAYHLAKAELYSLYESAASHAEKERLTAKWRELRRARDLLLTSERRPKEETFESAKVAPGGTLLRRYQIHSEVATGSIGTVYVAHDSSRRMDIALKVISPELVRTRRGLERFKAEAADAARLAHPNIAQIFDVLHDGDVHFLTMELLSGESLRRILDHRRKGGGAFSVEEVLRIADAVVAGLAFAHRTTVHRDVKPANVFLCSNGRIKLTDFGMARVLGTAQKTKSGIHHGVAHYFSPEQLKGAHTVDARSDQYSLAVMLFELLTFTWPNVDSRSLAQMRSDMPAGFSHAVEKALSRSPDDRYATIEEFGKALHSKNAPRRKKTPRLLVAAILALCGAGAAVYMLAGDDVEQWMRKYLPDAALHAQVQDKVSVADELAAEWTRRDANRFEPGLTIPAEVARAQRSLAKGRELLSAGRQREALVQLDTSIRLYSEVLEEHGRATPL